MKHSCLVGLLLMTTVALSMGAEDVELGVLPADFGSEFVSEEKSSVEERTVIPEASDYEQVPSQLNCVMACCIGCCSGGHCNGGINGDIGNIGNGNNNNNNNNLGGSGWPWRSRPRRPKRPPFRRRPSYRSIVKQQTEQEDGFKMLSVLGSKVELKLYSTDEDRLELYNSAVTRAALYERSLDTKVKSDVAEALNGRQYGVLVTLDDGRRFFVVKGNRLGEGSQTVAVVSDHMADDWVKVTNKVISGATLGDFIKAGGHRFDAVVDNGKQAALRMMALA